MQDLALQIAQTPLSLAIQNSGWIIAALQSVHILAIGMLLSALLFLNLQLLGLAGRDTTLLATRDRFFGWIWTSLLVLLGTGALLVVGEPERELLSVPFWIKMALVVCGVAAAFWLRRRIAGLEHGKLPIHRPDWASGYALLSAVIWIGIVTAGRLIAYVY